MALERTYNVPLRKEFHKSPKYKRSKKAVLALKQFLAKHMKSDEVKLGRHLNEHIWAKGIKNPPHHVKVNVVKDDDGVVKAELFGFKYEELTKAELEERMKEEEKKEKKEEKKEKEKVKKKPETLREEEKAERLAKELTVEEKVPQEVREEDAELKGKKKLEKVPSTHELAKKKEVAKPKETKTLKEKKKQAKKK